MKILVAINDVDLGGAQNVAIQQANTLVTQGYDVTLLTLLKDPIHSFSASIDARVKRIELWETGFTLRSFFQVRNVLKSGRYSAVVTHLFLANTLIRLAWATIVHKSVIVSYEHNVYAKEKTVKHLIVDKILSYTNNKIVAVSDEIKRYLLANGIKSDKVIVIKNGIKFPQVKASIASVREVLARNDEFFFVSVGHVIPQKGHDMLLQASKKLVDAGYRISVCIIGPNEGSFATDLINEISAYSMQDSFQLLGARSDVVDIVNAADAFVMPSRYEGHSIALLEALMLGKPVIVSDLPGYEDWLVDENNALVHEFASVDSLAQKMIWAIKNREKVTVLGMNGKKAANEFTIEQNVKSLERFLHNGRKFKPTWLYKWMISLTSLFKGRFFSLSDQKSPKWSGRAVAAVQLLKAHVNPDWRDVADLGCGDKKINLLLASVFDFRYKYQGYDILPQTSDIRALDFNHGCAIDSCDIAFCLGLIEYLGDLDGFLHQLNKKAKYVLLSSVVSDTSNYSDSDVLAKGWVNYKHSNILKEQLSDAGFRIAAEQTLDNGITKLFLLVS